ncbi:phosphatase [Bacillus sp. FJAT-27225]|uniref:Cof-type HAD-IIB family hydrolase n=1 Tax=Bacillus sp. FJAT-27225 TaxID=1743144 RepID=UPI00080C28EE|nr:Cof-type HAD-IIB family hydrolase [Bacillus sp. FJAT-27225]OCA87795.1 phosphatase [Bacillus sp. FJAT-27225]
MERIEVHFYGKTSVFFDIDGTLLDHDKKLPASTKAAVTRLKELGHEVALATGRAPFMFKDLLEELGIDSYISFNGSYVVHKGKPVYSRVLDKEELIRLTLFAEENANPIIYENHEKMFANIESHPHMTAGIDSLKINQAPIYDPAFYEKNDVYQLLLFCLEDMQDAYAAQFKKFEFVRWHQYSVDVLPAGGSKAKGVEAFIQHLNIPKKNVYAFGDGLNDIEMLTYVENSVAMGNSEPIVKGLAKYVTHPVDEDGILKGLQLVGLL